MNRARFGGTDLLVVSSALAMAVALGLVFLVAPREATMGDVQRVFYLHVPCAWVGYLALLVSFLASVLFLSRRDHRWDGLAYASTEIGLLFITQAVISGSIWAKATWGIWWAWEPRLTTSAVLWTIYASSLVLRRALDDRERRARIAAVYSVLGFVAVPINFMAIRWWRTVHPLVFDRQGAHLSPLMLAVLIYSVFSFTLLYVTLLVVRLGLLRVSEQLEAQRYR